MTPYDTLRHPTTPAAAAAPLSPPQIDHWFLRRLERIATQSNALASGGGGGLEGGGDVLSCAAEMRHSKVSWLSYDAL